MVSNPESSIIDSTKFKKSEVSLDQKIYSLEKYKKLLSEVPFLA